MSAQTAVYPASDYKAPAHFAFLSKPPPPTQKKRPTLVPSLPPPPGGPLPPVPVLPRARSSTFSNIANWASHVQPGSPAPHSPRRRSSITSTTSSPRRPSLSRRPSVARLNISRRPSISHNRAPSGSFSHIIDTQSTPSVANFDLTALGYTTLFVHLPKTPTTPSPLLRKYNRAGVVPKTPVSPVAVPLSANFAIANIPVPPIPQDTKRKGMKRFRSLSILRPKSSKSKTPAPTSPTKAKPTAKPTATSPTSNTSSRLKAEIRSAHIAQRKRAKYAYVRPPPPLANELAMMQFADGGSMDANVKRVMEAQARMAKGSGAADVGVADVYRDGNGGIWWDADEELEYVHLLGGENANQEKRNNMDVDVDEDVDMDWEEFDVTEPMAAAAATPILPNPTSTTNKENHPTIPRRRPSLTLSLSSIDSDLDPKYLLPLPENEDPRSLPIDDRVLASTRVRTGGANMGALLSLPARPRRRALHLCKPGFLVVDGSAWGVVQATAGVGVGVEKKEGKAGKASRRRPAPPPLKLAGSNVNTNVNANVSELTLVAAGPEGVVSLSPGATRKEFDDSFAPRAVVVGLPASQALVVGVSQALVRGGGGGAGAGAPPPPAQPKSAKPFRMRGFGGFFTSSSSSASRRAD